MIASSSRAAGSVALDIGPGRGALIVRTGPSRAFEEIEVTRSSDGFKTHVAVLARQIGGGTVHAAVFGSLPEGMYRLTGPGLDRAVAIASGEITEFDAEQR